MNEERERDKLHTHTHTHTHHDHLWVFINLFFPFISSNEKIINLYICIIKLKLHSITLVSIYILRRGREERKRGMEGEKERKEEGRRGRKERKRGRKEETY